ncbi:MAG TPA: hypothetical protein VFF16_06380 [Telluria sp.]|nr:hypothetical protein [Telluria sp.]
MAKTNFQYEKRQRELEKKRKQEEKARRKMEAKSSPGASEQRASTQQIDPDLLAAGQTGD